MVWLRVACLLLGALAVMAMAPLTAVASPAAEAPCHTSDTGHHPSPAQPDKPMKAMGCCIVCTSAAVPDRIAPPVGRPTAALLTPAPSNDLSGLLSGPEPGPPRI